MNRFIRENFSFVITVVDGKKNNEGYIDCRNGHEIGDIYVCEYGCPADLCQKCMLKAFPIMEAVRAGGDLRDLGGESENKIRFCCPDGVVIFQLEAIRNQ